MIIFKYGSIKTKKKRPAVFLDRDGTIIDERGYRASSKGMRFYPTAIAGLKKLCKAGYRIVVISNQSGVARGFFSKDDLAALTKDFVGLLKKRGIAIDGVYYCPHGPDDSCPCRKPKPGLLKKALRDFNADARISYMIGDQPRDIEAGEKVGLSTFLVSTGGGRLARIPASACRRTSNLLTAANRILKDSHNDSSQ